MPVAAGAIAVPPGAVATDRHPSSCPTSVGCGAYVVDAPSCTTAPPSRWKNTVVVDAAFAHAGAAQAAAPPVSGGGVSVAGPGADGSAGGVSPPRTNSAMAGAARSTNPSWLPG